MNNYKTLMAGRLGYYAGQENLPAELQGVNDAANRINQHGGVFQQKRMIADKLRSLKKALNYSYQGANIQLLSDEETNPVRALINPNTVKQDYDDKIISVEYGQGLKCGSVFEWLDTKTYWIIYLQDLTELAYFRGDIRKCNYQISWENEAGQRLSTYAAIKGPVETKIESTQKNDVSYDLPNYSLNILIPKNADTLKYFKRYNKFYLKGDETCWRIEAVDIYSMTDIIQVHAIEYYSNKDKDNIEEGIVDGNVFEPIDPNPIDEVILGETFILPKVPCEYTIAEGVAGSWSVDASYPVKLTVSADNVATIEWTKPHSGQFILNYGDEQKTIIVESLF